MNPPSTHTGAALRIREAREEDAGTVVLLLGQLGYPSSIEAARRRIRASLGDPDCDLLVACEGPQVVGLASFCRMPYFPDGTEILRVTALVVAKEVRRRGVGAALLERARELARHRGCSGVEVTTAERRTDAHAFYRQMGFQRTAYRFFRPVGAG